MNNKDGYVFLSLAEIKNNYAFARSALLREPFPRPIAYTIDIVQYSTIEA